MTSTTKISALDFHDKLIEKKGIKDASGFSAQGRATRFEIIIKCLSDFPDPHLILMDYGCNDGELLTSLTNLAPVGRYIGVDVNPKFIAYAKNKWASRANIASFWVGNALVDTDHSRITQQTPDIVVASGTMCYQGQEETYPELIRRLYESAKQGLIFNVIAAEVPKMLMNTRLVKQSEELYRWKAADLLHAVQKTGCAAWDIRHGYLHNDITVVMRKRWTHFR